MTMSRGSVRPPPVCADCSAPDPTWASINRGVLICDECCSVHRSLGRHISMVKSLKKGQWCPSQHTMVYLLATNGANNIWEHTLLDPSQNRHGRRKPGARDPLHPNKSDFIRAKYQFLSFVNKQKDSDASSLDDVSKELHSSVRTNNVETCLRLLSKGANPNYFHREKGNCPMHVAAQAGQTAQVELLAVYGADPGARDANGRTPIDYAKAEGYTDLADRLLELQYELTDRLTFYICGRKPDHRSGQHFKIPELGDTNTDLSELAKQAKKKLQDLPNHLFEELAMDVYDEVDRRENDSIWLSTHDHTSIVSERLTVPHLPVNPELSTTRNQGRQKLARFNAREFATLVFDILNDARRRQTGIMSPIQTPKEPDKLAGMTLLQRPISKTVSALSDDEPLYDSVASDEDYSSIDTQSMRSINMEMKDHMEGPVTTEEFMSVRRALAESQAKIQQLVQVKSDLEKHLSEMHNKMESLIMENKTLRNHRSSAAQENHLPNGLDSEQLDLDSDMNHVRQQSRRPGRPSSMIEMRDSSRHFVHSIPGSGGQMSAALSVSSIPFSGPGQGLSVKEVEEPDGVYDTPSGIPVSQAPYDPESDRRVQEVLSAIRESSESEGRDSVSSQGATGDLSDDPTMPTQAEVVKKTEKVTKKIQELLQTAQQLQSAQEGNHNSFAPCSERIYVAVTDMAALFPKRIESRRVQEALNQLTTSALRLRDECKDWPPTPEEEPHPDFRLKTQQVIQYAYDIAKAAKNLVTLFQ
ncbi:hypothetical protein C0Q70_07071 [Pomacea canaliculata]|uniref:Arf-GAP domain-containing protein n=1 Tax=Pomacea canaliculata TaxID=400727 RepID=A0A2T7PE05_POMCA|nr:hypothetical protein C0Q70_07071 [Pomacea canaliculata]